MLRSRYFWKLFTAFMVVIFLATVFTWIFVSRSIEAKSMAETEDALRSRTFLLRELALSSMLPGAGGGANGALQAKVQALGPEIGTRLTLIRADGLVLADSEEPPASMDKHGTRPEVLDAKQRGEGWAVRYSNTLDARMMYFALPIRADGELLGYARSSLSLAEVEQRLGDLRRSVALGGFTAAIGALLLGIWLARRISLPLQEMTQAARAMAAGRDHPHLSSQGSDEVSELASAFDTMSDQLRVRLESLTSERNKLKAIFAGMVEGVIAVNSEERVLHMNEVAGRLLDANPQACIGKPIWEGVRVSAIGELLSECMESRTQVSREIRQTGSAGERIISLTGAPLEGDGGPAGAVLVLHEITDLRRLESVRRDFVANVSHELKTPLTAIRGMVETLEDDGGMPGETRRRFLRKIRLQTEFLSSQVSDLLILSRIESVDQRSREESVDLREILKQVSGIMAPAAEAKGLSLSTELPEEAVMLLGERDALEQAISNLLDNAVKYTMEGGSITLRLKRMGSEAVVEVEDTGIGIETRQQQRIFERFYRVDKGRSREMGGTGLGLAIVKHVVLKHGGVVDLDSQPGRGSKFSLTFPLSA